ncbi:MAG: energy transducer TonB [Acidobacteriaceae bacterium]
MTSFATREHSVRPDTGLPPRRSRDRERVPSTRQLATFGLLPEPEGRNKSFVVSLIVNASAIALFLILSIFMVHQVVQRPANVTDLLLPITPVKPVRPTIRVKPPIVPPTPDLLNRIAPKITYKQAPADTPQPKLARVHLNNVSAPVLPPYRPDSVALPAQPKVGLFHTNIPTAVANNMGQTSTKTGGFGDPMGVHPNPGANRPATIAAYGSFQSAVGDSSGSGSARRGKVGGVNFGSGYANGVPGGGGHGKVASVGFSDGVASGTGNGPRGKIQQGAFKDNTAVATPKIMVANTGNETTVEVISHPRPEYTPEAKQLKIQGDVVLEVRFSADGRCHVIRVVRGLGHGLDEQAIRVAEETHFKPATRDGQPVDITTYYRIDFQLA